LKVEDATDPTRSCETDVTTTVANGWQTMEFDFANQAPGTAVLDLSYQFKKASIFFNFGVDGATAGEKTYYFDDVMFGGASADPNTPIVAAPTPTRPAANVISMFSNAYTNVPVDTWQTSWSQGTLTDVLIAGDDTKKYTSVNFVGVETVANQINASSMLYFHVDLWTPNMTTFKVKLVDFGADAGFGGGDDTEHELSFTPTLSGWNSYEIALADFTGLVNKNHIAQLIFSGTPSNSGTAFIDNVYFHNVPITDPNTPMVAATTPTRPASNVISMFSNAYTNVPVDTWQTSWSQGTLTDVLIDGDATKKYSALNFVGVETVANQINASSMLYFHVDAWTPNMTGFRVKLVDFGADAAFGGGDDTEHELSFTPTLSQWNSYDIALSDFTGLVNRNHIAQLIFAGSPANSGTLFVDNVYFANNGLATQNFNKEQITMFPNPSSSTVTISAETAIQSVAIYNILGQQVQLKSVNNSSITIDISNLQNGVYIVKTLVDGKISTSKLIKE
jgi:Secretion system C-terminal sorting domain